MSETTRELTHPLVREGPVIAPLSERPVPPWVTDGWYSNNASAQKAAIVRWKNPVTAIGERVRALQFVVPCETFSCSRCGRFAFPSTTVCRWCRS